MSVPLLRLTAVTKYFGAVRALKGVSFDLLAGEVHALLGENGAGKSTLIKIITGACQPDHGEIKIEGKNVGKLNPSTSRHFGIAAIYQQPALFPDLSVAENIALGLETTSPLRRVQWSARQKRATELLRRVGANINPESEAGQLSMPEQQLVEIARALGAGARILIMDEPTASLSATEVDLLLKLVIDLRSQGVAILYITHRLEEVFQVADRLTVLRDGESVGTRCLAASEPKSIGPTEISILPPALETSVSKQELIQMIVGREVSTIFPARLGEPGRTILELRNLNCRSAGIRDVTLEVRQGEILGLAGLVGSGRTELARVLFGITPADGGEILIEGARKQIQSPRTAIDAGIGYLPEDRRKHGVILEMAVAANVTMGIHNRIFPGCWLRLSAEQTLAGQFIQRLGIKTPSAETLTGNLSGGNQQKVALARWLATQPRVLILDEPTQGVDIGSKVEIHKLLRRLAAEGLAVLMISSELPEILGMSDRIAVMREGSVVAHLSGNCEAREVMAAALGQMP